MKVIMKIQVIRDIAINAPASKVYDVVGDLTKWNIWSPWIHCEPTAKTDLQGKAFQAGQSQTWNGEVIGSGKMTISELIPNKQMKMKLEFLTPFKSQADITFDIQNIGANQTKVIWTMNSSLPFFMFFFKNMMVAYMGADFSRGLSMLKEYVETGAVVTKAIYQGVQEYGGFKVLGKRTTCAINDIGTAVKSDYDKMNERLKRGDIPAPEFMIGLYHNHNIPKGTSEFTSGFAYRADQTIPAPSDLELFEIPPYTGMLIDHYGPYRNIGNAWSMGMAYQRGKKKKLNTKVPMHEIYKTMPGGNEKDIYTQVILPVRK